MKNSEAETIRCLNRLQIDDVRWGNAAVKAYSSKPANFAN
jgi:hypothetical protein